MPSRQDRLGARMRSDRDAPKGQTVRVDGFLPEGEGRILLVLDAEEHVQHHGAAAANWRLSVKRPSQDPPFAKCPVRTYLLMSTVYLL